MTSFSGPTWRLVGHLANKIHLERLARRDRWLAVLFHHVTDGSRWRRDDPLIHGLNVDISVDAFKKRLRWLTDRYEFVSLDAALEPDPLPTGRPKLLLCFDDGYASVFELAAPILNKLGIPWCFFINPGFVGNNLLAVDNMVAYIANVHGVGALSDHAGRPIGTSREFIADYLSAMPPRDRRDAVQNMAAKLNIDLGALARAARLYVDEHQIRALAEGGVEIGCHTFDHVHCRTLDWATAAIQIEASAREVGRMSGRPVRAFAYPYGSVTDATPLARDAVRNVGHKCAFLVHNRANFEPTDRYALYRVDIQEMDDARAALELEVLPRIRGTLAGIRAIVRS